ncbi:MAG TPA: hypothetical protein VLH75_06785 [Longimicrobiales bacterium]|nr:hypothetical protein [Longimicrobiales bacterium]
MSPRLTSALLWTLAVVLMLSTAVYQRLTGPTHPMRGSLVVEGQPQRYRLLRSEETVRDARIALPAPSADATGRLVWRRYPTGEEFRTLDMALETTEEGRRELAAYLPAQPSAGKLEYRIEVDAPGGMIRIPSGEQEHGEATIVLRYKDPVPLPVLLSHIAFMFFGVLIGMRAALGAAFAPRGMHAHAWITLALMTVGGMILGPIVQKYAFGAYWTGFPWGYDLTDNKTLIMWVVWIGACAVLGWKRPDGAPRWRARVAVLAAAVVMTVVYLIPHSLRGSELDYSAVDSGTHPSEAVGTGQ